MKAEFSKALRNKTFGVVLLLCLMLNAAVLLLSISPLQDDLASSAKILKKTGQIQDAAFFTALQKQTFTKEEAPLAAAFLADKENIHFAKTFEPDTIAAAYQNKLPENYASVKKIWAKKFTAYAHRTRQVQQTNAMENFYAGEVSYGMHQFLFGTLTKLLAYEGIALVIISTLFLFSMEKQHHLQSLLCTTKKGKKIYFAKYVVSLIQTLSGFLCLSICTVIPLLCLLPQRFFWQSQVASAHNFLQDIVTGPRPFVTWADMTVWQYLIAILGLIILMLIGQSLLFSSLCLLMQNHYIAMLAFCLGQGFLFILPFMLANDWPFIALLLTALPLYLTANMPIWFTDLGMNSLTPYWETLGITSFLLLTLFISCAAWHLWRKKDIFPVT